MRSKLVLGFVVALGVGGLGIAAVAMENDTGGAGALADDTTTTVVDPSTTVPSTLAPTTTVAPAPVLSTEDPTGDTEATDQGVERSTDGCDGGTYANHGEYVSSIATSPDREPGDVPAAAQSDCGKPLTAVGPPETEAPVTEAPVTEAPETGAGDTGHPGQGKGRGASGK